MEHIGKKLYNVAALSHVASKLRALHAHKICLGRVLVDSKVELEVGASDLTEAGRGDACDLSFGIH